MPTISYVIPVYNNAGSIRPTWEAIRDLYRADLAGNSYEVIFVDDGSRDESYVEMQEVRDLDPDSVRLVRFTRNFGQVPAIVAGYREAKGDAVVNMSADLQDPVSLTVEMIRLWGTGIDVVAGYRNEREDGFGARLLSRLAYGVLRLSNPNIPAGGFDFVLMSRKAVDSFLRYRGRNRFYQGDILWAGHKTAFLPYTRQRRSFGKSQYKFGTKLKMFLDFLLDGSYLPIRVMSLVGLLVAAGGALYAAIIVISWAFGRTPFSGWAPIMIATLLLGGTIMMMLGLIGEYLWRILDEIKDKPLFIREDGR